MEQERPWQEYEGVWVCVVWGGGQWCGWLMASLGCMRGHVGRVYGHGGDLRDSLPVQLSWTGDTTQPIHGASFPNGKKKQREREADISGWSMWECIQNTGLGQGCLHKTRAGIQGKQQNQCFIRVFVNAGGGKWQNKLCDNDRHYKQEKKTSWTNVLASRNKSGRGHPRTLLLEKSSVVEQLWLTLRERREGPAVFWRREHGVQPNLHTILSRLIHKKW